MFYIISQVFEAEKMSTKQSLYHKKCFACIKCKGCLNYSNAIEGPDDEVCKSAHRRQIIFIRLCGCSHTKYLLRYVFPRFTARPAICASMVREAKTSTARKQCFLQMRILQKHAQGKNTKQSTTRRADFYIVAWVNRPVF